MVRSGVPGAVGVAGREGVHPGRRGQFVPEEGDHLLADGRGEVFFEEIQHGEEIHAMTHFVEAAVRLSVLPASLARNVERLENAGRQG